MSELSEYSAFLERSHAFSDLEAILEDLNPVISSLEITNSQRQLNILASSLLILDTHLGGEGKITFSSGCKCS